MGPVAADRRRRGATASSACWTSRWQRASAFAEAYAGRVAALDGPELRAAMEELAAINDVAGKAASYASLQFSTDTADPQRGALLQRMQERAHRDGDAAAVLRARMGGARRRAGRAAAGERWARVLCSLPAQRPSLPAASAVRARGEGAGREEPVESLGMGAAVRRADLGAPGVAARRRGLAGARAERAAGLRPRRAAVRRPRRSRPRSSPAHGRSRSSTTR